MARLKISKDAKADLDDIWAFYADRNEATADRVLSRIEEQFRLLVQFPLAGRARDELSFGLRGLSADNHIIFYRVLPNAITIIRVLNARQDIEAIFKEDDS